MLASAEFNIYTTRQLVGAKNIASFVRTEIKRLKNVNKLIVCLRKLHVSDMLQNKQFKNKRITGNGGK